MTDRPTSGSKQADEAPELHNSEQDDEPEQTQTVADEALSGAAHDGSPLDSTKKHDQADLMDNSSQDLIDHMRDMEQSGRVDMDAYEGEPNHDDNEDKYGEANKIDPFPSDGAPRPKPPKIPDS